MHLPSVAVHQQHQHSWNTNSSQKGGMHEEPPNNNNNSSSSQDLWWTERLVIEAQQEFPGELGEFDNHSSKFQIAADSYIYVKLNHV